jgi:hypothetical protein
MMPMTNNTERKAFEEWFYDLFPMGIDDKTEALMLKSWQAALAQREQEAPKQDELAESSCTAEEAAELVSEQVGFRVKTSVDLSIGDLAAIINADRARNKP